ncbi:hypothetical protein GXP67_12790 [Rhodocytophaga rosea]|uniref:Uncharacterized protein n=1 Tax=Rhodocytophaga rosea TaxID=2704465 RepID=A0A6C0GI00_9BACT|nr:hypothetical protein [Rhodocytophaga rosea]QHT67444.1 hypothetical protein GXP67_12790 [Rhodocytophaga rosea]
MRLLLVIFYILILSYEGLAQKQLTPETLIGEWKIVHYPIIIREIHPAVHHSLDPKAELLQQGDTLISFNKKEFLINRGQKKGKYKIRDNALFLNSAMYIFHYDSDNKFHLSRIMSAEYTFSYWFYRIN